MRQKLPRFVYTLSKQRYSCSFARCSANGAAQSGGSAEQASAPYDYYTVVFDKNTIPDGTVYKENFKEVADGVSDYSPTEGEAAKIMYISFS